MNYSVMIWAVRYTKLKSVIIWVFSVWLYKPAYSISDLMYWLILRYFGFFAAYSYAPNN